MGHLRMLAVALLLIASVPVAMGADQANADSAERGRLAGTWKGFAVEGKGERPDRGPAKLELVITDKTIHGVEFKGAGQIDHGKGDYVLDLKAKPASLDASQVNERGRKDSWVGIYRIEGDTLYWCVGRKERPTTFETVKGQFLMILKRGNTTK